MILTRAVLRYMLLPFAASLVIVLAFERSEFSRRRLGLPLPAGNGGNGERG